MHWKPNIFTAIMCITGLTSLVILIAPDFIETVAVAAVTGIVALGMRLLEKE